MIDKLVFLICLFFFQNTYRTSDTPPLYRESSPPNIARGSPRLFRVKRVSRAPQTTELPPTPQEQSITTKSVVLKDTTSRGTTPPPNSFFETFPKDQSVYYPTSYQMRGQQGISTVRYRSPSPLVHPTTTTTTTSDVVVQNQPHTNASTTTKTSTRILDATTVPSLGDDSYIEETRTTTTIIRPQEIPVAPAVVSSTITTVPQVTTVAPAIETTTIRERPAYRTHRRRRIRTISTSPLSDYTTSSISSYTTTSTVTPRHHVIKQHTILPPRPPIHTTIINDPPATIVPERRYIHRARRIRTHSGYYSSDLDYGKRKIYKSDYKYRHYYYCNYCKGRCDLPNSSCGCCEWFYGCPLWALIFLGLLLLALIVTFFTLLGLQPTINPTRRSETAETQVLNRTQIVYGFLQNCGSQANTPTTLALCANTQTTSTSRTIVTSYYTLSKGINKSYDKKSFILFYSFWIYFFVNLN